MDDLIEQLRNEMRRAAVPAETTLFSSQAVASRAAALRRRHRRRLGAAASLAAVLVVAAGLVVRTSPQRAVDITAGPSTSGAPVGNEADGTEPRRLTYEGLAILVPPTAVVVQDAASPCPTGLATVIELGSARCPGAADHEVIRLRRVNEADAASAGSCRFGGVDQLVGCTLEERWHRTTLLNGGLAVDVDLVPGREETGVAATIRWADERNDPPQILGPELEYVLSLLKPGADQALVAAFQELTDTWKAAGGPNRTTRVSQGDNRLGYLFVAGETRTRIEFGYGYDLIKGQGTWWIIDIKPA